MEDGGYMKFLAGQISSILQDFECYLRTEFGLVENDIRLALEEYNSSFIAYEISPGNNTFKEFFEVLSDLRTDNNNHPINIVFDIITMRTKLALDSKVIAIKFNENSFFSTGIGFTPHWVYKHYNEYISQKIIKLSTTNKIHIKCVVIDGIIVTGLRQPILFSFVLDKPSACKVFCEPETIHYKKLNKLFVITFRFYLENDNNEKVNFNGETLTFTLQLIKN